jgi:hypothetical protein
VNDLGGAAALVLAVVFMWAAVAKLRTQPRTTTSFRGLGLPAPRLLAKAVPAVEAAVTAGLVAAPALAAWPALALVLAFSVIIGRAVAAGSAVSCACFGGAADDARPVSVVELVRNAGLGALAIVASGAGAGRATTTLPALVIVTVLVALARVAFAAADLRRLGGHVFATPLPGSESARR